MKILTVEKIDDVINITVDVTPRIISIELDSIKDLENFKATLKRGIGIAVKADEREEMNGTLFQNIKAMEGEEIATD